MKIYCIILLMCWSPVFVHANSTNDPGGLQLGSGLQDSMVVQQNRPLTIWGKAPAGAAVSIRADWMQSSVTVKADADGSFLGIVSVPAVQPGDYNPHSI